MFQLCNNFICHFSKLWWFSVGYVNLIQFARSMAEVINRISMQDSKGFFHWGILRGEIEVWKKIKLIMKPAILQNRISPKQHPATRNKPTKKIQWPHCCPGWQSSLSCISGIYQRLSYLHCKLSFCSFMNTSLAHWIGANSYVLLDLISISKMDVVPM